MSDEIKKILDNVKKCCDITKDQSFTVYQRQDILVILDCITNLQEENKELKKKITFNEKSRRKMQQSLMEQIEIYKSKNEKANYYIWKEIEQEYDEENNKWIKEKIDNLLNILNGENKNV